MSILVPAFAVPYPVIGVIHLRALPGAPHFGGDMSTVLDEARATLAIFEAQGIDGVIVENFHDIPFFPGAVPPATVAAMAAITQDLVARTALPIGVNVLRNDGEAALAIAAASGAQFVRINVLGRPVISEQGIINGDAAGVMRLRAQIAPSVAVFADAAVKHAAPLVPVALDAEIHELTERCGADVIVVSGDRTGLPTDPEVVRAATAATGHPVFIGSGVTPESVASLAAATGFIVGSAFKEALGAPVEPARVAAVMDAVRALRANVQRGDR